MKRLRWSMPLLFLAPAYFFAQDIKGTLQTSESGEAISGATVLLQPGDLRTRSGLDGSFEFDDLQKGDYTVTVSHPLFKTFSNKISVSEEDVRVTINLSDKNSREIGEVVLRGVRKLNTEYAARRLEQRAPQVLNVVSGNAIQISPDLTVANVIQRVSGVSVERSSNGEGQYAILRGMDKRYNYTLVNGIKIPSPDSKHRYVPLDIFPSELLDRLEVYKSLLPNMEGDAVGGAVNMVMKNAPTVQEINVNLAVGYSQYLFGNKFRSFDKGVVNFRSPYELNGRNYAATMKDFPADVYNIKNLQAMPNFTGGLTLGRRFFDKKLGVLAALSYQNTNRMTESTYYSASNVDIMKYAVITSAAKRNYYENQQRFGLHTLLDYVFNDNNKIQLYNAFMQLQAAQLRESVSANPANSNYDPSKGSADISYSYRNRLTQQRIWNTTLKGEHKLIPEKLSADWSAVVSSADNQIPDMANYGTLGLRRNFVDTPTTPVNASRSWMKNTDTDYAGYLNFSYKIVKDFKLKFGGMYRDKQRSNFYNNYVLFPLDRKDMWGVNYSGLTDIKYDIENPKGSVANSLTYNAGEKIGAGYVMVDAEFSRFHVLGGVRFENTDQYYKMLFPMGEDRPELHQKYTDALPSASVKYKLAENQNLRATYFRSVNRPGFFEIVPSRIVYEEYVERGNPDTKHAIADNIDLRYEFFPKPSDQLLVGVFYKKIKDPIEYTLQPSQVRGQDTFYIPGNFGTATNFGAELDLVKFFSDFGFKANYTYTNSNITTPKTTRIRNAAGNLEPVLQNQKRPLYGQSEHIGNLSLLYKNSSNGWDAQLSGSYTGPRINTVSQFLDNDIWQKGFVQMDASLEKKFKNNISVFIKANNLLNTPTELFIKGINEENHDIEGQNIESGKTLLKKEFYGQTYLLGVRFKL